MEEGYEVVGVNRIVEGDFADFYTWMNNLIFSKYNKKQPLPSFDYVIEQILKERE